MLATTSFAVPLLSTNSWPRVDDVACTAAILIRLDALGSLALAELQGEQVRQSLGLLVVILFVTGLLGLVVLVEWLEDVLEDDWGYT